MIELGRQHRIGQLDSAVITVSTEQHEESTGNGRDGLWRGDAEINRYVENVLRPTLRALPVTQPSGKRKVIVYIHGFNDTFRYAVRKTAQFAGDLGLVTCDGTARCLPITYSWPAEGNLFGYIADEESAEWTQQRLEPFLRSLSRICHEENADLDIIAHSMGARVLIRSLADIANSCEHERGSGHLVNQVVLLAPDIGKEVFDQYVERILPIVGHFTVYVSAKDQALSLSTILHGGHYRLGFLESSVLAALKLTGIGGLALDRHRELAYFPAGSAGTHIDMIDVSNALADPVGHSYQDPAFIGDLKELIVHGTPAGSGARSNLKYHDVKPGVFHEATGERLRYFQLKPE